jgi:hypothetical protein
MKVPANHIGDARDIYGWAQEQAALVRGGQFHDLDLENIAREIEDWGIGQRSKLEKFLKRLMTHLLKWQFEPSHRGNSWSNSIDDSRIQIARVLLRSPSVKPLADEEMAHAYLRARLAACGLDRDRLA